MFRPRPPTGDSFPYREQCALGLNTENTLSQIFTFFFSNILTIRSERQTDRCMDERMDRQTDRHIGRRTDGLVRIQTYI